MLRPVNWSWSLSMPERVDILDAQSEAQEGWSELDTYTLISLKRAQGLVDDAEDLQYVAENELYYDEDPRTVAYDAVKIIRRMIRKLESLESEIYTKI